MGKAGEAPPTPTSLFTIRIWEGENLEPKDSCGTSDPYCIFGFVNSKGKWVHGKSTTEPQKTHTIQKTLNPKWLSKECLFSFPPGESYTFRIEVWDRDRLSSDDFMGQIDFNLATLEEGVSKEEWYELKARDSKDIVSGKIKITFRYDSAEVLLRNAAQNRETKIEEKRKRDNEREKAVALSNVQRWINCFGEESISASDSTEAAIDMYEWCAENPSFYSIITEYALLSSFMSAIKKQKEIRKDDAKFFAIICGILGKFTEVAQKELLEEGADEYCLACIHYATPVFFRESRQLCLLLLLPYFSIFSNGEENRIRLEKFASKLDVEFCLLLRFIIDTSVNCEQLVVLLCSSMVCMARSIGIDFLSLSTVCVLGNLLVSFPGNEFIYTQISTIFYIINQSGKVDDLLVPITSTVLQGLDNTFQSKYPGTSFEENENVVKVSVPLLAFFVWLDTPKAINNIRSSKLFFVLGELLRLYSKNANICHNVVNIIYGCLERGEDSSLFVGNIANVAYHLVPLLTKNVKMYSRHDDIVSLSSKIFCILQENEICNKELTKAGALTLLESLQDN